MARSAEDIYEVVNKKRESLKGKSAQELKEKCVEAVTEMMKEGDLTTEVELSDSDMAGLTLIIEELRDLGYKHCLIETQDENGHILHHRLRISIAHLDV